MHGEQESTSLCFYKYVYHEFDKKNPTTYPQIRDHFDNIEGSDINEFAKNFVGHVLVIYCGNCKCLHINPESRVDLCEHITNNFIERDTMVTQFMIFSVADYIIDNLFKKYEIYNIEDVLETICEMKEWSYLMKRYNDELYFWMRCYNSYNNILLEEAPEEAELVNIKDLIK